MHKLQRKHIHLSILASYLRNASRPSSMLYHLITLNPQKDITLHVSINNPAVVKFAHVSDIQHPSDGISHPSCFTIASASKLKSSLWDSTGTILTPSPGHPRMLFDCDSVDSTSCYHGLLCAHLLRLRMILFVVKFRVAIGQR